MLLFANCHSDSSLQLKSSGVFLVLFSANGYVCRFNSLPPIRNINKSIQRALKIFSSALCVFKKKKIVLLFLKTKVKLVWWRYKRPRRTVSTYPVHNLDSSQTHVTALALLFSLNSEE